METLIADYLSKLEFGELQSFKNMGVIPLLTSINGSPKYLTLKEALEKKYKSVGQGTDHRFEGKAILGSALLYRKKVIHMAFFRNAESSKTGRMSSYSRRREFRI